MSSMPLQGKISLLTCFLKENWFIRRKPFSSAITAVINKAVLLQSKGNCTQYPVISHNGKEYEECIYIRVSESLCCTAEINTLSDQLYFNKYLKKGEPEDSFIGTISIRHCAVYLFSKAVRTWELSFNQFFFLSSCNCFRMLC